MYNYFKMEMDEKDINARANLSLAYLGDAVYELMVRTWLLKNSSIKAGELHKTAVGYVKASAQAKFSMKLLPLLSEKERAVFKRGRNCHVNSVPQNAEKSEYHMATGMEALFGYLYLSGETERLCELFDIIIGEQ